MDFTEAILSPSPAKDDNPLINDGPKESMSVVA